MISDTLQIVLLTLATSLLAIALPSVVLVTAIFLDAPVAAAVHLLPGTLDKAAVIFCLKIGCCPKRLDFLHRTSLIYAAKKNNVALCRDLLGAGVPVNICGLDGMSAVSYAARHNNTLLLPLLFSHGADLQNIAHQHAIREAIKNECYESLEILIQSGASLESESAFLSAACDASCDMLSFLVSKGFSLHQTDFNNNTLLIHAAGVGRVDIAQFCLDHGLDINACNHNHHSSLFIAAKNNHDQMVEFLIDHGADIELPDLRGVTPLLMATEHSSLAVIETLVYRGASLQARALPGKTVEDLAVLRDAPEVISFFEQIGVFYLTPHLRGV